MISLKFAKEIGNILNRISDEQSDNIMKAAEIVRDTIKSGGLIFTFGCGHSHLVALDSFYRAGGLANVSAVLDTDLMLHNGAAKSSAMERMADISPEVFKRYNIGKNDCIFIISSSGINGVPVEMALCAKKAGVRSVAITSMDYAHDTSRHMSGMHLYEAADMYIDCCVPHGDAVIDIGSKKMGSVSTVAGTFILQSVLMEASEMCAKDGINLPIYLSGNIEGGSEHNKALIDEYIPRVKHL